MTNKITPCIWYSADGGTLAGILSYYGDLFGGDFQPGAVIPLGETPSGHSEMCDVTLFGRRYTLLCSAEPHHPLNDAVSFVIECAGQDEIDRYWNYFTAGGEESQCGWCQDLYGLRWQIIPDNLEELMSRPGGWDVMMGQRKIIIDEY